MVRDGHAQALLHCGADGLHAGEGGGVELLEGGEAGGDRDRVARERAGLVDRARGRELAHEVGATTKRGEGEAAADDLAEAGQVGGDVVQLLRGAVADAEPAHHLVEDQQRAVLGAQLAE